MYYGNDRIKTAAQLQVWRLTICFLLLLHRANVTVSDFRWHHLFYWPLTLFLFPSFIVLFLFLCAFRFRWYPPSLPLSLSPSLPLSPSLSPSLSPLSFFLSFFLFCLLTFFLSFFFACLLSHLPTYLLICLLSSFLPFPFPGLCIWNRLCFLLFVLFRVAVLARFPGSSFVSASKPFHFTMPGPPQAPRVHVTALNDQQVCL